MRTTLTIDDDVAARLEQLRKATGNSLKAVVNSALRAGVQQLSRPSIAHERYVQPVASAGGCRVSLISVSEALAVAEGEAHK
jgi:hypothetical protein